MNLKQHYEALYTSSIKKIKSDKYETDPLIDSPQDKRMGLTLIIRPSDHVKTRIKNFLDELRAADPHQYYYPESDMHITVMSVISAYPGFDLQSVSIPDYTDTIKKSLAGLKPFDICFSGLSASPSCIMIRGFFNNNTINTIRDNLRANFRDSGLQQSMDSRYVIETAHSTVVRFREKLSDKERFLNLIEQYHEQDFGTFTADTVEFVCNDWYQRKKYVSGLCRFRLNK